MKITQVRNATLLIHYAGTRFLIDPMLAPKGSYPGFEGMANSHLRNPLVELPLPMATLLEVDAVIVTHDHLDHWDDVAKAKIPKHLPCSCSIKRCRHHEGMRLRGCAPAGRGRRVRRHPPATDGRPARQRPIMALLGIALARSAGVVFSHPAERPSIWPATPSGMPRLNKRCTGTNPRSSSSTAVMPR